MLPDTRHPRHSKTAVVGLTVVGCATSLTGSQLPIVCPAICRPPAPQLIYPQSGATGVRDGSFELTATASNPVAAGPFTVPSPGPTPPGSATPRPGYQEFVSHVPALAPSTTYTVALVPAQACFGIVTLGSFTTQ